MWSEAVTAGLLQPGWKEKVLKLFSLRPATVSSRVQQPARLVCQTISFPNEHADKSSVGDVLLVWCASVENSTPPFCQVCLSVGAAASCKCLPQNAAGLLQNLPVHSLATMLWGASIPASMTVERNLPSLHHHIPVRLLDESSAQWEVTRVSIGICLQLFCVHSPTQGLPFLHYSTWVFFFPVLTFLPSLAAFVPCNIFGSWISTDLRMILLKKFSLV